MLTPDDLPKYWAMLLERGDREIKLLDVNDCSRYFNNNSVHDKFQFALTKSCKRADLDKFVDVETAEKAIALSKAALMGDYNMFYKIKDAKDVKEIVILSRQVTPYDEDLWNKHVIEITTEVVFQKF